MNLKLPIIQLNILKFCIIQIEIYNYNKIAYKCIATISKIFPISFFLSQFYFINNCTRVNAFVEDEENLKKFAIPSSTNSEVIAHKYSTYWAGLLLRCRVIVLRHPASKSYTNDKQIVYYRAKRHLRVYWLRIEAGRQVGSDFSNWPVDISYSPAVGRGKARRDPYPSFSEPPAWTAMWKQISCAESSCVIQWKFEMTNISMRVFSRANKLLMR